MDLGPGELSTLKAVYAETEGNSHGIGDEVSITHRMQDTAQDDPNPGTVAVRVILDGLVAKGLLNANAVEGVPGWSLTEDGRAALFPEGDG
jgi:hypothetical protein